MKFERLNVPEWPLPDLVAFNERVHGVIDPWWRRRWVRLITWAGATLFALIAAMWLYFASTLPSAQYLLAYQPPLPTNVRGYNGEPVQTFARERRVDLSFDEYPPLLVHAFISAEDKGFFEHHGLDYGGFIKAVFNYTNAYRPAWPGAGRIDDHPASREISAARQQLQCRAQGARSDHGLPARGHAQQAADPRALPQFDLPRAQCLWRAGGRPRLFRQGRQRADLARGGLPCRPAPRAGQLRSRAGDSEGARPPRLRAPGDVQERLHHGGTGQGRGGDSARHHPLRQQREVPPAGRLFHGRGPPRAEGQVRRGREGRAEQPLRRRPLGAQLDGPDDAGRCRSGAARRTRALRRQSRLDRSQHEDRSGERRLGGAARPRAGRHGLP